MKWLVHGQVGISFAPGAAVELGNVIVGDLPGLPPIAPATLTRVARAHSVALIAGVPDFHTNGWYTAEVAAPDPMEAERIARDEVEPVLHAALSLAFGYPVIVRFHSMTNAETGEAIGISNVAASASTRDLPVAPEMVVAAYEAVQGGKAERAVVNHLKRAHDLHLSGSFGDSSVSYEAELLELAKAIEAMARSKRFQDHYEDARHLEDGRGEVVHRLEKRISDTTTAKAAEAIKSASDDLKRLETAFSSQQVDRMSLKLGLDDEWRHVAQTLGRLRNKTLAHSGPGLSEHDRQQLLSGSFGGQAWWAVVECFAALCGASRLYRPPDPEPEPMD